MDTVEAQQTSNEERGFMATARRLPMLVLLAIPAAAVVMWDEVLLAGPIVFLTETLGFVRGLVAFTLLWAGIGIGALVAIDYVWPAISRWTKPLTARSAAQSEAGEKGGGRSWTMTLGVVAVTATVAGIAVAGLLFGAEMASWAGDHRGELGLFFVVALVIFAILATVDWIGRGIERWVRRIASTAGPRLRSFAALMTMVYLGPVLGWGLFPMLGYTRRATYALTLLAAPIFAVIWVPFYSLGVWGAVEEWM